MQVVAFKLRDEEYGVNIFQVQEIRNLVDITRVPFSANYIKGVINLRGSVLPVIDLKKRLGLEQTPYTDKTRIVTVKVGDLPVGMLVDAVTEVLTIPTKLVEAKKAISEKDIGKFVSGIGNMDGRLVIMLNLEEIVGLPN
ncbi:MAG: chemotaxis protein CheW [Selenomonadaceae bacterium]|nr:chemotaxis protein CheW [Selenomonadaceae bacterium]